MTKPDLDTKFRQFGEKYPRTTSLVIALVGLAACYWLIALPIEAAAAHARQIDFLPKAIICAVAIAALGLIGAILGPTLKSYFASSPVKGRVIGVGILITVFFLGMVAAEWLRHYLKSQGYNL